MNKAECIAYAARCRTAAAKATERAALFAATFGGDDELTKRALARVERDNSAAREWDKLAAMHPQTRAKLFRDQSLPSEMFGYSADKPAPDDELVVKAAKLAVEAARLIPRLLECTSGETGPSDADIYAADFEPEDGDVFILRAVALLGGERPRDAAELPKLAALLEGLCNGATGESRDADIYARDNLDGDAYVMRAAQLLRERAGAS
jgi:hypothetical protein